MLRAGGCGPSPALTTGSWARRRRRNRFCLRYEIAGGHLKAPTQRGQGGAKGREVARTCGSEGGGKAWEPGRGRVGSKKGEGEGEGPWSGGDMKVGRDEG